MMFPLSGFSKPPIILNNVDFPQPDVPCNPKNSDLFQQNLNAFNHQLDKAISDWDNRTYV